MSDEQEYPCHWTHGHGRHPWTPIVPDPEHPQVLHLLGQTLTCPGKPGPAPDAEHTIAELSRQIGLIADQFVRPAREVLDEAVAKRMADHKAAIERAVEESLQGGEHGVSVRWNAFVTVAVVDERVPYGHLWEYPYGQMED